MPPIPFTSALEEFYAKPEKGFPCTATYTLSGELNPPEYILADEDFKMEIDAYGISDVQNEENVDIDSDEPAWTNACFGGRLGRSVTLSLWRMRLIAYGWSPQLKCRASLIFMSKQYIVYRHHQFMSVYPMLPPSFVVLIRLPGCQRYMSSDRGCQEGRLYAERRRQL